MPREILQLVLVLLSLKSFLGSKHVIYHSLILYYIYFMRCVQCKIIQYHSSVSNKFKSSLENRQKYVADRYLVVTIKVSTYISIYNWNIHLKYEVEKK